MAPTINLLTKPHLECPPMSRAELRPFAFLPAAQFPMPIRAVIPEKEFFVLTAARPGLHEQLPMGSGYICAREQVRPTPPRSRPRLIQKQDKRTQLLSNFKVSSKLSAKFIRD